MQWIRRDVTPLQVKACLYLKVNFVVAALPMSLCNSDFSAELLVTSQQLFIPNSKVRPLAGSVRVLSLKNVLRSSVCLSSGSPLGPDCIHPQLTFKRYGGVWRDGPRATYCSCRGCKFRPILRLGSSQLPVTSTHEICCPLLPPQATTLMCTHGLT